MDTGPVEPKRVGTPGGRAVVMVGLFFIAGVVVVVGAFFIRGIIRMGPEVKQDWKYLSNVRKSDAATVEAERAAGREYKDKIAIEMRASVGELGPKGYKVTLSGNVTNNGTQTVLKVTSPVAFQEANGAKADGRELTLLNAVALSPTPDSPLAAGDTRAFAITVSDVSTDWDKKRIDWRVGEVRLQVQGVSETTAAE
jgi:hypothetical protein